MNGDQVEGKIKEVGGELRQAAGTALGDDGMEARGAADSLTGKAQEAYGNVREKAHEAYDSAVHKATDAYGRARETVKEWADDAPEYLDRARESGRRYAAQAGETVKTTVQEQPIATVLGGVAVGFLLGWLINSRR